MDSIASLKRFDAVSPAPICARRRSEPLGLRTSGKRRGRRVMGNLLCWAFGGAQIAPWPRHGTCPGAARLDRPVGYAHPRRSLNAPTSWPGERARHHPHCTATSSPRCGDQRRISPAPARHRTGSSSRGGGDHKKVHSTTRVSALSEEQDVGSKAQQGRNRHEKTKWPRRDALGLLPAAPPADRPLNIASPSLTPSNPLEA